jgi:uncharacterized protein YqjF (DUF2071 family)
MKSIGRSFATSYPQEPSSTSAGGRALVSVVGFRFLGTRLLGVRVPGHVDFEEVNLRFSVRRQDPDGRRRGVVFVKELGPRRAIALLARLLYNENYVALQMSHRIQGDALSRAEMSATEVR